MEQPQPAPAKKRGLRLAVQGSLALLVSVIALWWAFHGVDVEEMRENLKRSSVWVVLAFLVGQLLIHGFRIVRWGMLIQHMEPKVSNRAVFAAANLGISATFFVPLRLGELIRPMLISRSGVPFGSAVASIVVERIADGLCSVGLFFIFFSYLPADTLADGNMAELVGDLTKASRLAAFVFVGGLFFLVAAALARGPVLGLTKTILSKISVTLAERIVGLITTFLDGLAALGSAWRALLYVGLTIAYWVGNGLLTWMLAVSYEPSLPVVSGLFTISVLVFLVMIPAGPAFAGTFEAGFKLGFGAFGLDQATVIVIAVVAHVAQLLMMGILVGAGFMSLEAKQRHQSEDEAPPPAPA